MAAEVGVAAGSGTVSEQPFPCQGIRHREERWRALQGVEWGLPRSLAALFVFFQWAIDHYSNAPTLGHPMP